MKNDSREHRRPRGVVRNQHRRMKQENAEVEVEGYAAVLREASVNPTAASVVTSKQPRPELEPRGRHTFGLIVPRFDWGDAPIAETLSSIAIRAEEAGFRDILLMDHFRQIRSVGRPWVTHLVNAITAPDRGGLRAAVDRVRPATVSFEEFVNKNNGALPADLIGLFGANSDAGADHSIVSLPNVHLEGGIEAFAEVISGMR